MQILNNNFPIFVTVIIIRSLIIIIIIIIILLLLLSLSLLLLQLLSLLFNIWNRPKTVSHTKMDYLNLENGMKINPLLTVLLENVVFSVFFSFC